MDLYIKYDNGSMVIHLDAFLDCRSIGKVKKLVKLIQQSYTPDELVKMREFVEQQLEQFEPKMKEDAVYISEYKSMLKVSQEKLDTVLFHRDCCKKNTDDWKNYNEDVKQYRQGVSKIKAALRIKNSDFDTCVKYKAFYEKVLETIS